MSNTERTQNEIPSHERITRKIRVVGEVDVGDETRGRTGALLKGDEERDNKDAEEEPQE